MTPHKLRLPTGRLELFRKVLNRRLQEIRRQVSLKQITKGQALDRGARIIRSHYTELRDFIRAYTLNRDINYKFNDEDFQKEIRSTIESWNNIVDDM